MSLPMLVALSPAREAHLVTTLRPSTRLAVARRCVDVADLLAAAAAGLGRAALVGADMPGLDRSGIADLLDRGVAVVGVAAAGAEDDERFLRQIGVTVVVRSDADLPRLEEAVENARVARGRRPEAPQEIPDDLADLLAAGLGADLAGADDTEAHRSGGPAGAPSTQPTAGPVEKPRTGRIVAVWGPTGAPGRSTMAVNLAAECADLGLDTLLVDADPYGGVVAAMLALVDEAAGLAAAVRASEQGLLDVPALAALTPQVAPGLRVLTGLPRADRWIELRAAGVGHVLGVARLLADIVVVDCGFNLEDDEELSYDTAAPRRNAATLAALESADDVVVVGSGDPVGLQRLVRGLAELDTHRAPGQRHVVVNRVRASAVGPGPQRRVEAALARFAGVHTCHVVPDDRPTLDAVTLAGRTLTEAARASPARLAIAALAARLVDPPGSAVPESPPVEADTGGRRAGRRRRQGAQEPGRRWRRGRVGGRRLG